MKIKSYIKIVLGAFIWTISMGALSQTHVDSPYDENTRPTDIGSINVTIPNSETSIEIFPSSSNVAKTNINERVYFYSAPLLIYAYSDGKIQHDYLDLGNGYTEYTFYLQISNPNLIPLIVNEWKNKKNEDIQSWQIQPLRISFIEISPYTEKYKWKKRIPEDSLDIPGMNQKFPVKITFNSRSKAEDFNKDLNSDSGLDLKIRYGYGGYTVLTNEREINTRILRDTRFVGKLQGEGGENEAKYVTREQMKEALQTCLSETRDTTYVEDANFEYKTLQWVEDKWHRQNVSWNEFMDKYLRDLSKFSYDPRDLSPTKITSFYQKIDNELYTQNKDHTIINGDFAGTAKFFGIAEATANNSIRIDRDKIDELKRRNEATIQYQGEKFIPRSILLYKIDNNVINQDHRIGAYRYTTRRSIQTIEKIINSSKNQFIPESEYSITPAQDVERIKINGKTNLKNLIIEHSSLMFDKKTFTSSKEFYKWLHNRPQIIVEGELIIDQPSDYIAASEIILNENGIIKSLNSSPEEGKTTDIKLLTLTFVNNGGKIIGMGSDGAEKEPDPKKNKPKGVPDNDPNERVDIENCTTVAGGHGENGIAGDKGNPGIRAGNLKIAALSIIGKFNVEMRGGNGNKGQTGGIGGDAGNGLGAGSGHPHVGQCRTYDFAQFRYIDHYGCGGGNAGNPGAGGRGGDGGDGGNGGNLFLATTTYRTSNNALDWGKFNLDGGNPGEGGDPGSMGNPGRPGDGSTRYRSVCPEQSGGRPSVSPNPPNGGPGNQGTKGQAGTFVVTPYYTVSNQPHYEGFYLWVVRDLQAKQ